MKNLVLLKADLSLFDEGTAATTGSTSGAAAPTSSADATQTVVYGKQPGEEVTAAQQQQDTTTEKTVDYSAQFEELIKGNYKDVFHERVQGIINDRFKESKTQQKKIDSFNPIIEILQAKYGTDDLAEIQKSLDKDIVEDLAYKNDTTPEAYRKQMEADKIIRQNQQRQQQEFQRQQARQRVDAWFKEADELVKTGGDEYAGLNLQAELENNPQFKDLLKKGINVKTAYDITHIDNFKQNVIKKQQQQTIDNIQAKKQRPSEAASKSQSGIVVKSDPSKFTKQDRAEIARRVQRGENIVL